MFLKKSLLFMTALALLMFARADFCANECVTRSW